MAEVKRLALAAMAILAVPGLYIVGASVVSAQIGASQDTSDISQASTLVQAINGETSRLPADTASIEDYEAAIMFAINQQDYSLEVILAALDIVERTPGIPNAERIAIDNVRRSLANRRRGTGALGDGVGDAFSTPSVGIGGGSTNYTT